MAIPQIPDILKKTDWDKHKGIIAKIAKVGVGETGIGAEMEKVKAVYTAVGWKKFDAWEVFNHQRPNEESLVDEALNAAKTEFQKVEKVRAELRTLQSLALKTQTLFKSKPLVPKTSTEHVGKIAAAADHMAVALKSMDAEWAAFDKMKTEITHLKQVARQGLISYIGKMPAGIQKMRSTPTLDAYETFHKELVRGLGAAVSMQSDLKAFVPVWKEITADGFKPKKDQEVPAKVTRVEQEFNKLKSAVK